ncbi:MAG: hypothetical protein ACREM8_11765 [Vulcanimicrobiaceae bacterium]
MDWSEIFGGRRLVKLARGSRLSFGQFEARGVPAILMAVTGIVIASGIARAIAEGAQAMPDSLREARLLLEATRSSQGGRTLPRTPDSR